MGAMLSLELAVALPPALQQERGDYTSSKMKAGPLSRETLRCLVCEEVAGMISMM